MLNKKMRIPRLDTLPSGLMTLALQVGEIMGNVKHIDARLTRLEKEQEQLLKIQQQHTEILQGMSSQLNSIEKYLKLLVEKQAGA